MARVIIHLVKFICVKMANLKKFLRQVEMPPGKIYSRVTKLLGMKPWEHEYKVMGLAPYANEKYYNKIKKNI